MNAPANAPESITIRDFTVAIEVVLRTIGRTDPEPGGLMIARLDADLTAALGITYNPAADDLNVYGWMGRGDLRQSVIDDISDLARRTEGVSMVRIYVRARNRWWGFFEVIFN